MAVGRAGELRGGEVLEARVGGARLRRVHREVGVAQERRRRRAGRALRDADARADGQRVAVDLDGRLERREHLRRDPLALRGAAVQDEHGELVAADPAGHGVAGRDADARADRLEQPVADEVPAGVVHDLEVVEVDEQERHLRLAARLRERPRELLLDGATVRQTRERVAAGEQERAIAAPPAALDERADEERERDAARQHEPRQLARRQADDRRLRADVDHRGHRAEEADPRLAARPADRQVVGVRGEHRAALVAEVERPLEPVRAAVELLDDPVDHELAVDGEVGRAVGARDVRDDPLASDAADARDQHVVALEDGALRDARAARGEAGEEERRLADEGRRVPARGVPPHERERRQRRAREPAARRLPEDLAVVAGEARREARVEERALELLRRVLRHRREVACAIREDLLLEVVDRRARADHGRDRRDEHGHDGDDGGRRQRPRAAFSAGAHRLSIGRRSEPACGRHLVAARLRCPAVSAPRRRPQSDPAPSP